MKILNLISFLILVIISCNSSQKNEEKVEREKENVYSSLQILEKSYIKNAGIYDTGYDGYKQKYITENGEVKRKKIDDKSRLLIIEQALESNFMDMLTSRFNEEILNFKQLLKDPINLGYLLTQNEEIGKTLLYFITAPGNFNYGSPLSSENYGDPDMPAQDIVEYHLEKIHIVNDTLAIYKNSDRELSFEEENDRIYFILTKPKKKWLLDKIIICKMEEEEHYDMELIGKPSPIQYYEPKYYE